MFDRIGNVIMCTLAILIVVGSGCPALTILGFSEDFAVNLMGVILSATVVVFVIYAAMVCIVNIHRAQAR
jgi:uncharacterized membrane protein